MVHWTAKKVTNAIRGQKVDWAEAPMLSGPYRFGGGCLWDAAIARLWCGGHEIALEPPLDWPGMEMCDAARRMFTGGAVGCEVVSIRPVVGEVVFATAGEEIVTVAIRSFNRVRECGYEFLDYSPPFQIRVK